jgi:hypothetical protein
MPSSPRCTSGKILIHVLVLCALLALFVAIAIPALHVIHIEQHTLE